MNKEEKIGMYTRKEILDYMQDREGSMLGRSMYDAVMSKIDTIQSQLDIANNKLKEIREYCNTRIFNLTNIPDNSAQAKVEMAKTFLSIIGSD